MYDFGYKLITSLFIDELQLSTEMETEANTGVADINKNVSKEVMIYGMLTNKILVGATVIGFTRSGYYMNKEFFDEKSEVYTILDVVFGDIEEIIQNHAKNPDQMKLMFQQIKQIGLNQILFVIKILEHQGKHFEKIETATDLFLIILRGNLAFQSHKRDTSFSKLLKDEEEDLMKTVFQLCKENLQGQDEDDYLLSSDNDDEVDKEQKQAGVINGTLLEEEIWVPDETSEAEIPLSFLKRVGIFEIPPTSFDQLTLTAQHLSFVEFFASVGIILNFDIKGSL